MRPPTHLIAIPGERRDCQRYNDCLDTFVKEHKNQEASCPKACRFHVEPVPSRAVDYTSSGQAAFGVW